MNADSPAWPGRTDILIHDSQLWIEDYMAGQRRRLSLRERTLKAQINELDPVSLLVRQALGLYYRILRPIQVNAAQP